MKSSDIIVMPVMVIEAINLLEQLADMKTTMDRPLKESAERDSQINIKTNKLLIWQINWESDHLKLQQMLVVEDF